MFLIRLILLCAGALILAFTFERLLIRMLLTDAAHGEVWYWGVFFGVVAFGAALIPQERT